MFCFETRAFRTSLVEENCARPPMVHAWAHEIAHPSGGALGKVHAAHAASAEELASPQQCGRFHMAPLDVHADHMERNGIDIEQ